MIRNWFKRFKRDDDTDNTWEFSEDPGQFYKEHEETVATFEEIMIRLDEIKALIDEMKDDK